MANHTGFLLLASRVLRWRGRFRTGYLLVVLCGALGFISGCSKPSPEQTLIGLWEMDKAATKDSNPFVAANPGIEWHEFNADGSYTVHLMGTRKGTWKQTKKEGDKLILELSLEGDKEPTIAEIAVVAKGHITLNYPNGLGIIHLKRSGEDVKQRAGVVKSSEVPEEAGSRTPGTKVDLLNSKPDVTMDVDSWHAEWKKDPETAKKKYKGKIIELTGVVDRPGDDPYGRVGYIYPKIKSGGIGPRCALDEVAPWLRVGPGCTIRIKGFVPEGYNSDGDLYPCVIVESSPNTYLSITALELTKSYAADKQAAEKKYDDKWLIVEGELFSKEPSKADEGRFIYLTLKGDQGVNVKCYVENQSEEQKKANDALKQGQKLKVCGEAHINEKEVKISSSGRMVTFVR
jgi:hypothetical protein